MTNQPTEHQLQELKRTFQVRWNYVQSIKYAIQTAKTPAGTQKNEKKLPGARKKLAEIVYELHGLGVVKETKGNPLDDSFSFLIHPSWFPEPINSQSTIIKDLFTPTRGIQ